MPMTLQEGYTLIETVLAVAVIALLAGLSIPVFQSFQTKNNVDLAADITAQSLRRAQGLAQAMSGDAPWGVRVVTTTATVFQGASYATRNASFDEIFDFSQNVTVSGTSEIVFSKLYGYPQPTGTMQLISSNGDSRFLLINAKGTVAY